MKRVYVICGAYILCLVLASALAKVFDEEKSFGDENKLHCSDTNVGSEYGKNSPNVYADYYKPRPKFDAVEKFPNKPLEYEEKRSAPDDVYKYPEAVQKRQVGVIYKDDKPIGILQPFQRSYRFIPVKEENGNSLGDQADVSYSMPSGDVDKRDVRAISPDAAPIEESYPSILTNFKIGNKLDKKRNFEALTDENVRDLKATIRRLRSSNPHNSEQIEEELKNILDDMGLIEDEESHGQKREVTDDQSEDENDAEIKSDQDKEKRDDALSKDVSSQNGKAEFGQNLLAPEEKGNDNKNDILSHPVVNSRDEDANKMQRKKRQKQETNGDRDNSEMVENLKDSGELMVSGNKSPLASSSEITIRDAEEKDEGDDDYEKRVERHIQNKINTLKEEVKREIEALKRNENDDEDTQRKKRQVFDTLINEETDEINPALNPENDLKPLVRKRRDNAIRTKRDVGVDRNNKRSENSNGKSETNREEDRGGELLGDLEEGSVKKKRDAHKARQRNKRSRAMQRHNSFHKRYKRQKQRLRPRFIRRTDDKKVIFNRPRQLSDMSDLDLFGALPKSYEGELSRYKRVRRN